MATPKKTAVLPVLDTGLREQAAPSSSEPQTKTTEPLSSLPSQPFETEFTLEQEPNPYASKDLEALKEPNPYALGNKMTTSLHNIIARMFVGEEPAGEPMNRSEEGSPIRGSPRGDPPLGPGGPLPGGILDPGRRLPDWIEPIGRKKEINIGKPEIFSGNRTKVKKFLQQCQLYLVINKDVYDNDDLKIGFVLSLMTKGEASDWAEQFLEACINQRTRELTFPTYNEFITKIHEDFKQEDEIRDAADKLKKLRQGNKTAEELVTEFRLLVGRAGFGGRETRDHFHLIERFQETLNPSITRKILYSENVPDTIEGWYKKAIQYDLNRRRVAELDFLKGKSTFKPYVKKEEYKKKWNFERPTRDPNAMDVDRMTIEERNDLMKRGACFFCKKEGHLAADCLKKKGLEKRPEQKKGPPQKMNRQDIASYIRNLSIEEKNNFVAEIIKDSKEEADDEEDEDF